MGDAGVSNFGHLQAHGAELVRQKKARVRGGVRRGTADSRLDRAP